MAAQRVNTSHGQQPSSVLGRAPREHARLFKELSDIQMEVNNHSNSNNSNGSSNNNNNNTDALGVWARLVGEDIQHWEGFLKGPEGTPYEGGCFSIDIQIPRDYPYNPPKMRFTTKIWHPNISSQTGAICLDILKQEWSPALTIRTALLSIQAMLADPVPTDPQDAEVAKMMLENPDLFVQTAKLWTDTFAKKGQAPNDQKVKMLTEMGFPEEQARAALKSHNWDETLALNFLLEGTHEPPFGGSIYHVEQFLRQAAYLPSSFVDTHDAQRPRQVHLMLSCGSSMHKERSG